eukprot:gene3719-8353_t
MIRLQNTITTTDKAELSTYESKLSRQVLQQQLILKTTTATNCKNLQTTTSLLPPSNTTTTKTTSSSFYSLSFTLQSLQLRRTTAFHVTRPPLRRFLFAAPTNDVRNFRRPVVRVLRGWRQLVVGDEADCDSGVGTHL